MKKKVPAKKKSLVKSPKKRVTSKNTGSGKQETEARKTHDLYWKSYITGDVETLTSLLGNDYTQIGSVENEVFFSKKDAVKFVETTIDQVNGNVDLRNRVTKSEWVGEFILVSEQYDLYVLGDGEWTFYSKFRASSLMKQTDNGWKLIHQHSSVPDFKAQDGESIAIEKITVENLQLRDAIKRRTVELEHKTRELEIEAAMEKVRVRSLAMQKPEELADVAEVLRKEMGTLGVEELETSSIYIFNEENDTTECWYAIKDVRDKDKNKKLVTDHMTLRLDETWVGRQMKKFHHSKKTRTSIVMQGENRKDWINHCAGKSSVLKGYYGGEIPDRTYHLLKFSNGFIGAASLGEISVESWDLLQRATAVFSFAYKRFSDLQKAEAQAREAEIELSLERVRSKAMAMHSSGDILSTTTTAFEELKKLGIHSIRCGIGLLTRESMEAQVYASATDPNGDFKTLVGVRDMNEHPSLIRQYESWLKQENLVEAMNDEELKSYYDKLFFQSFTTPATPQNSAYKQVGYYFSFADGLFYTWSDQVHTENEISILTRFKTILALTFRRFLDLQKAEAQAREAQIEAALERVRSKAMAMHNSEDLALTVDSFFVELRSLNVIPRRCGVTLINDDTRIAELTVTTATHDGETKKINGKLKLSGHPILDGAYDHWKLQKEFHPVLRGAEIVEYYRVMNPQIAYPDFTSDETQYGYYFFFKEGGVFAWTDKELEERDLEIFRKYTSVLSLTYRRFIDLKEAEAQALRAEQDLIEIKASQKRAEEALAELQLTQKQLIQSEKMASLGELTAGIAHEIQNPLNFVNNFSDVSTELIDEMNLEIEKGNSEEAKQIAQDLKQNLEKINHHGKRAGDIVKGMLQHSRISSGQKELTDINALADEYLRLAYHGLKAKDKTFNAKFETNLDETLPKVNVIPQDIGRVILNLINNAFYAVSEKSRQGIVGYEPTVIISTNRGDEMNSGITGINNIIKIIVKDNGNGIPQKVLDKIFQPFFTTKPTGQGTGLGLSLSYDIVKAHGGALSVNTTEGEGSDFSIQLPNV